MDALLIEGAGTARVLRRVPLGSAGGRDEAWLQGLLHAHPEVLPIELIDPGAGGVIPICRELPLPREDRTVFLDLLGVTGQGRLVLVECKLWRNPQARREVIAQIFEYAALLRQWTYADLTARLKRTLGWSGPNPLFEHVRGGGTTLLDEARFVDAVSRSLSFGDFDLIVAGDGIRSDLVAITSHLGLQSGLLVRLALVEFQLWADEEGRTLVVPALPLRTEVVRQRVIVGENGAPLPLEAVAEEATLDPERALQRRQNRAFWQRLIDEVRFDHPDQPPPRHGGNNWVRLELPPPAEWMTLYRNSDEAGLVVTLTGDEGANAFARLREESEVMEAETGLTLGFETLSEHPFKGRIGVRRATAPDSADADQAAWLKTAANAMVGALRPRLGALARER